MKIKNGTLKKDVTAYGEKYWIQIHDTNQDDNSDLQDMLNKKIIVVFDDKEKSPTPEGEKGGSDE